MTDVALFHRHRRDPTEVPAPVTEAVERVQQFSDDLRRTLAELTEKYAQDTGANPTPREQR